MVISSLKVTIRQIASARSWAAKGDDLHARRPLGMLQQLWRETKTPQAGIEYLQREGPSLAIPHKRLALPPPPALIGRVELRQGRRSNNEPSWLIERGTTSPSKPAATAPQQRPQQLWHQQDSNRRHTWTGQRPAACLHSQLVGLGHTEQRVGAPRNLQPLQAAGSAAVRTKQQKEGWPLTTGRCCQSAGKAADHRRSRRGSGNC